MLVDSSGSMKPAASPIATQFLCQTSRRMPVVNHDKRLVGIVSISDLAKEEEREAGHALSEIAKPSGLHSQ